MNSIVLKSMEWNKFNLYFPSQPWKNAAFEMKNILQYAEAKRSTIYIKWPNLELLYPISFYENWETHKNIKSIEKNFKKKT